MSKFAILLCSMLLSLGSSVAFAGGSHYHCEKELKSGKYKVLEKIKSKRKCEKKGGSWVKHEDDHDHDHEHEDGEEHDHSHSH